jgi:hypothetical protein
MYMKYFQKLKNELKNLCVCYLFYKKKKMASVAVENRHQHNGGGGGDELSQAQLRLMKGTVVPPLVSSRKWPEVWARYTEFESYAFDRQMHHNNPQALADFIAEWQRRLTLVVAAGCRYSDAVLALKLLAAARLNAAAVNSILTQLPVIDNVSKDKRQSLLNEGGGEESRWALFEQMRTLILAVGCCEEENSGGVKAASSPKIMMTTGLVCGTPKMMIWLVCGTPKVMTTTWLVCGTPIIL